MPRTAGKRQAFGPDTDQRQALLALEPVPSKALRNDQALSAFPFFGLSKKPLRSPIVYNDPRNAIRVNPGEHGIPTIYDKGVIIALVSILNRAVDRGEPHSDIIVVKACDLIRTLRPSSRDRSIQKREYQDLRAALNRLRGSSIETNIVADKMRVDGAFSLITEWRILSSKHGDEWRMEAIEVRLCSWLYRAVAKDRRILKISPRYFELSSLGRRLYEIARKSCYPDDISKPIPLAELAKLVGSQTSSLRFFKRELADSIRTEDLPEYEIQITGDLSSETGKIAADAGLIPSQPRTRSSNARLSVVFKKRSTPEPQQSDEGDVVLVPNL
jgi:Replication initiator protein A